MYSTWIVERMQTYDTAFFFFLELLLLWSIVDFVNIPIIRHNVQADIVEVSSIKCSYQTLLRKYRAIIQSLPCITVFRSHIPEFGIFVSYTYAITTTTIL